MAEPEVGVEEMVAAIDSVLMKGVGTTLDEIGVQIKGLMTARAYILKARDEIAERPTILTWKCDDAEGWIAWIDYMVQGTTREEAQRRFVEGWRDTILANADAGITPDQMVQARYPDTAGQLAAARAEITEAMTVLAPSMPESGLVDACRQVKQAAISWKENTETAVQRLESTEGVIVRCYDAMAIEPDTPERLIDEVTRLVYEFNDARREIAEMRKALDRDPQRLEDALDEWWHEDHFGEKCDGIDVNSNGGSAVHSEECVSTAFTDGYAVGSAPTRKVIADILALLRGKRTKGGEMITSATHAAEVIERDILAELGLTKDASS